MSDDLVDRIRRDPERVATLLHEAYGIIGDVHRRIGATEDFDVAWWEFREEHLGSLLYPDTVDAASTETPRVPVVIPVSVIDAIRDGRFDVVRETHAAPRLTAPSTGQSWPLDDPVIVHAMRAAGHIVHTDADGRVCGIALGPPR